MRYRAPLVCTFCDLPGSPLARGPAAARAGWIRVSVRDPAWICPACNAGRRRAGASRSEPTTSPIHGRLAVLVALALGAGRE